MNSTLRKIELARSGPYFACLLALVPLAFWPSYLSKIFDTSNDYVHLPETRNRRHGRALASEPRPRQQAPGTGRSNPPTAIAFGVHLLLWLAILNAADLQDFPVWR